MPYIQTVCGPIAPEKLGTTLIHEHVMCDFIGAEETGSHRWGRAEVVQVMRPHLEQIKRQGITAFGDCSPRYIGRDPWILRELSELTGLHIITNTGFYKEPYVPQWAMDLSPGELAEHWIREWDEGIEGSGVRPGFIKIAVNPGPLVPLQQTIVRAAAITHLATGLTVASHTGHYQAAMESLDLIEDEGMDPRRFIVVHAQNISNTNEHLTLARRGAWLEYDGIGPTSIGLHAGWVVALAQHGYMGQLLISHDAGWYSVGEPKGGTVRPYTTVMDRFVPMLAARVGRGPIAKLLVENPARALSIAD